MRRFRQVWYYRGFPFRTGEYRLKGGAVNYSFHCALSIDRALGTGLRRIISGVIASIMGEKSDIICPRSIN